MNKARAQNKATDLPLLKSPVWIFGTGTCKGKHATIPHHNAQCITRAQPVGPHLRLPSTHCRQCPGHTGMLRRRPVEIALLSASGGVSSIGIGPGGRVRVNDVSMACGCIPIANGELEKKKWWFCENYDISLKKTNNMSLVSGLDTH